MVGGTIIGITRKRGEPTTVNVQDTRCNDRCAIQVHAHRADNGVPVVLELGDAIWWQGPFAMWTPRQRIGRTHGHGGCGKTWDIQLPRVGYSFAS